MKKVARKDSIMCRSLRFFYYFFKKAKIDIEWCDQCLYFNFFSRIRQQLFGDDERILWQLITNLNHHTNLVYKDLLGSVFDMISLKVEPKIIKAQSGNILYYFFPKCS